MTNKRVARFDGFSGGASSHALIRGLRFGWDSIKGWKDADGVAPPKQLLLTGATDALQRWRGKGKPEVIADHPLPDENTLNENIPISEWEKGPDGLPRPPWSHVVVIYGIDIVTGAPYTYISATTGGHIAYDQLMQAIEGMRLLRGGSVLPLVELGERPMRTRFGDKSRPAFNIVSWKEPASLTALEELGESEELESQQAALTQASDPVKAEAATPARRGLKDVKPVSPGEAINDKVPW